MADWFRYFWNTPNHSKSPYKYFGGVLVPIGNHDEGNVVYSYAGKQ